MDEQVEFNFGYDPRAVEYVIRQPEAVVRKIRIVPVDVCLDMKRHFSHLLKEVHELATLHPSLLARMINQDEYSLLYDPVCVYCYLFSCKVESVRVTVDAETGLLRKTTDDASGGGVILQMVTSFDVETGYIPWLKETVIKAAAPAPK